MDDRDISSEQEYLEGKRADGRPLKYPSRQTYTGPTKPFSEEPAEPSVADVKQNPRELQARYILYRSKQQKLRYLNAIADYGERMMQLGLRAMDELEETAAKGTVPDVRDCPPSSARAGAHEYSDSSAEAGDRQSAPVRTTGTVSNDGDSPLHPLAPTDAEAEALGQQGIRLGGLPARPYEATGARPEAPRTRGENPPSGPGGTVPASAGCPRPSEHAGAREGSDSRGEANSRSSTQVRTTGTVPRPAAGDSPYSVPTLNQRIWMGERGCKLLRTVVDEIDIVTAELIDLAKVNEARDEFMEDRAVAVVHGTLLHLDEHFRELGFGAWMPFRWPDQWLSFCGVLRRVLAANGLIHAKYADTYRKLLDETPPVELKGTVKDRVAESRTPLNPARCKSNQGAYTLSELEKRLNEEVWKPKEKRDKEMEDFWEKNFGVKPPDGQSPSEPRPPGSG